MVFAVASCTGQTDDAPSNANENSTSSASSQPTPTYEDMPNVLVDDDGMRSFPAVTRDQQLDALWEQAALQIETAGGVVPERPEVELIRSFDVDTAGEELTDAHIACMHNAGWTTVEKSPSGGYSVDIPEGQDASFWLADYTCNAQYYAEPSQRFNEEEAGKLWDQFTEETIPCLEENGFGATELPSREVFLDQWFAESRFTTPYNHITDPQQLTSAIAVCPDPRESM